ncbi:MAG: L,D-transpeptidase family protein [Epsilonproteobacteria bacterium]|nr:L,D-transpeptidase family protein [Campylobacterota bacterium]
MKRFLLLCLLLQHLAAAADSIVETYRTKGIAPIEKMLDRRLADPAYWQEVLKKHDTVYGYFDHETDLLLCSKSDKILKLYSANSHFHLKQKSPVIIGKLPGDKQREGDLRTPIGVYRILSRKTDPGPEYGPVAFVTNYPNRYDRILGKEGHGIWLHGFPLDCDDKDATKGCIAIRNDALKELDKQLDFHRALLIISEQPIPKISKKTMSRLLAFIYDWRYAWKYNDYDAYIDHYAPSLTFQDNKNFKAFKAYKKAVFAANRGRKKLLRFSDLKIVPYPNAQDKNLWFVSMREEYKSGNYRYNGPKELLVEELPSGRFQIVVE